MAEASESGGMPKWQPAPEALVLVFERALLSVPEAQARQVFGYPTAFVNGQMFAGLHQDRLFVRLSAEDRASLLEHQGAQVFEPLPGRQMHEYVVVPPSVLRSEKELNHWLGKALEYAMSLPPKAPKARRKKATA
jgi:TfoX/Sxy family transcriptional regulator of competence genes